MARRVSMSKAKRLLESLKRKRSINEAHLSLTPEYVKLFELRNTDKVMEFFQPMLEELFNKALLDVRTPSLEYQYNPGNNLYQLSSLLSAVQRVNSAILEFHKAEEISDKNLINIRIEDALEDVYRLLASWKASEIRGKDIPSLQV